jgi:hypothetical protein
VKAGYAFLASFGLLPIAGWPLLSHPIYRRYSLTCRLVLAAAVGAVFLSWWMTILALTRIAWSPVPLFLLTVATSALLRLTLRSARVAKREAESQPSVSRLETLALFVSALSVFWALLAARSGAAASTDMLIFWGPKADAFARARTIDASYLDDPLHSHLHASYPPLVTNLFAFATMVAGRFPWGAATLTFPLALGALATAVPGILRPIAGRRLARAATALVVAALGLVGATTWVGGNADPLLWLFEAFAVGVLLNPAPTTAEILVAGLFLAGACSAKVEGLPFALTAVALWLVLRRERIGFFRNALLLSAPAFLSLGAWFAFGAIHRLFRGYEGYGRLAEIYWDRLPAVLGAIGSAFWSSGFALPFVLPLLALIVLPPRSRLALLPLGIAVALSVFFVFTYLHGALDPAPWIEWSAARVFSSVIILFVLTGLAPRFFDSAVPESGELPGAPSPQRVSIASRNARSSSAGSGTSRATPEASATKTWGSSGLSCQVSCRSIPRSSGTSLSP